tara:strand:+ start:1400 stop:1504 length:105 start_codon:yes stop_codon:yes gene_type:complete
MQNACYTDILAQGFLDKMTDDDLEEPGYEIIPKS